MKILFIYDGLGGGGQERRFVQLVKGLNDMHYGELHLLMTRDVLAYKELENLQIKITYILRSNYNFTYHYFKFIKQLKPDIIQIWSDVPLFYYNFIRFFITYSNSVSFSSAADCDFQLKPILKKILYLFSYRWLDAVVGNSIAGLRNYRVPLSKLYCIYNGFDTSRLNIDLDRDIRKELNIKTRYVVSMMARFSKAKDWKLFVDTALYVLDKRDDVSFLAVGDGETRTEIESYVPNDYKNRILFLGRRNDVEPILRGTDVSVLCTNPDYHAEGVSNSILESFAFGVPVIATQGGGTSEILENGKNGYIVEPQNKEMLSQKINLLLDNQHVCHKMGRNARYISKEKFSLENTTMQYIQLFDRMLNSCF